MSKWDRLICKTKTLSLATFIIVFTAFSASFMLVASGQEQYGFVAGLSLLLLFPASIWWISARDKQRMMGHR